VLLQLKCEIKRFAKNAGGFHIDSRMGPKIDWIRMIFHLWSIARGVWILPLRV